MEQSRGKQSIAFAHPPCIESSASVAGKKEGDGPLGHLIDLVDEDPLFGEDSWEKAESTMQKEAARIALKRRGWSLRISAIYLPETCWGSSSPPFSA